MLQHYKTCNVPGIGRWEMEYVPARENIAEGLIYPPQQHIIFNYDPGVNGADFISYVAEQQNILSVIAGLQVEKNVAGMNRVLDQGQMVIIPLLGQLTKNVMGEIEFTPNTPVNEGWDAVQAPVIIHQPAAQTPADEHAKSAEHTTQENPTGDVLLPVVSSSERSYRWLVWTAVIIGLFATGGWAWFHFTSIRPHFNNNFFTNENKMQPNEKVVPPIADSTEDTTSATGEPDTTSTTVVTDTTSAVKNDSIRYKIIFGAYNNKAKAIDTYNQMIGWGWKIFLLLDKDSVHAYIGVNVTSLPQDTALELEKVKKTYGGYPHIMH
jgi:hypothetical protein